MDDGQKSLKIMVSKSVRIEAELAEKDQLLQRAAEIIGVGEWVGDADQWLADYESRNVSTSSEVATDGDAQEER